MRLYPAVTARAIPPPPPRDARLDLVRGWLQLTIFASHAAGSWIGHWLIHGAWGLSDSSEQFVFLSGYTLGSVFARNAARLGWGGATRDILRRAWRLYVTQLVIFALFASVAAAAEFRLPGEIGRLHFGWLFADPLRAAPAGLAMLFQPEWMGILPVFIWCMAALPCFAALEARFGDRALLVPCVLYACVWLFGLIPPALGPDTGIGFNPFAWQILFMTGAWLGRRRLLGRPLPRPRWALWAALLVLAIGLAVRLGWYGWIGWTPPVPQTALWFGKESLAWPRVVHALALAWVVAALVPRDARWMHRSWVRWLAPVGRHSLHMFCLGLFLSWGAGAAFRLWPGRPWLDPALIAAGCLVLAMQARWLERRRTRKAPPAPMLAAGAARPG